MSLWAPALAIVALGCAASPAPASGMGGCPGQVRDDCWRAHWPLTPCAAPTEPELVGVWGVVEADDASPRGRFAGRLLYDGCHVTIWEPRELPLIQRAQLRFGGWTVPHYHGARRTVAHWREEELVSRSVFNRGAVARRVEVGGAPGLELTESGQRERDRRAGTSRLIRLDSSGCMDAASASLICARQLVPRCLGPSERFPDCELSPPEPRRPRRASRR